MNFKFHHLHFIKLNNNKLDKEILLFLVCLFMLSSCSEDIKNPPWDIKVVPVVFSVITPDQKVQVYVGKSYSGNEDSDIATDSIPSVFISEKDSAWVELERSEIDSTLFIDTKALLKVNMGKTYLLKVDYLGKTIFAQTSLPTESGIITDGECMIVDSNAGGSTNGSNFTSNICALNVHVKLPANNDYGCYLTAFSDRINGLPFLSSEDYLDANFTISKEISSFQLNIITVDPNLKKFILAQSVSSNMFDSEDITDVLASYGGVYPSLSNIQNGVGLFGSFLINNKIISVTKKETTN